MLLPRLLKLRMILPLLRLVLAIAHIRIPRRRRGQRSSVAFVRHGLEFERDVVPLRGEGERVRVVFGVVFVGRAWVAAGGDGFFVGVVVVVGVGGVGFVNLDVVDCYFECGCCGVLIMLVDA